MKRASPSRTVLLALPCVLALAGCDRGEAPRRATAEPARMDTTNQRALDGLSAEQIRAQAEAMSPERAEALGIIDTTIHVESLQSPDDSILPPLAPRPAPPRADSVP